jgi:transketolase
MAARWALLAGILREIDGHDMAQICEALDWADANVDAPSAIVAHTVKGKGISFLEGQAAYHNAALSDPQVAAAEAELEALIETMGGEA